VKGHLSQVERATGEMRERGIAVSAFVDADISQIKAAIDAGVNIVEIHTGPFADARDEVTRSVELDKVIKAALFASKGGLKVSAGHGLNYTNVGPIVKIQEVEEMSIGHSIIARAIMVGMGDAVREMLALIA
jgi:pyridoxine 5-phosphate synthase